VNLIGTIYRALGDDPDFQPTPNLGSRSLMQLFRRLGFGKCLKICWGALRERPAAAQRQQNEWRFPASNPHAGGEVRFAIRRLTPERFDAMRAYGKARGATLNDIFMAAYFRSLFQFLDPRVSAPQKVFMPMDFRRFLPSGRTEAICNFIALLPVALANAPEESFEDTLKRVTEASKISQQKTERALFRAMLTAAGYRLLHAQIKRRLLRVHQRNIEDGRTVAWFSNLGALSPEQMDFGLPVADAYMIGFPAGAPWVFLAAVSFRKSMSFDLSYSSRAIAPEVVEHFLDRFIQELPAAEAASSR
jgi:NRPS condensation-like uncharacterized protein